MSMNRRCSASILLIISSPVRSLVGFNDLTGGVDGYVGLDAGGMVRQPRSTQEEEQDEGEEKHEDDPPLKLDHLSRCHGPSGYIRAASSRPVESTGLPSPWRAL